MILGRLRVGAKLNLLVVIPLLVVVLLYIPLLSGRLSAARTSATTEAVARTGRQIAILVEELQQARLLAVARKGSPAVAPNDLVVQLQLVRELGSQIQPTGAHAAELRAALTGVDRLVIDTGPRLVAGTLAPDSVIAAFGAVVDRLVAAVGLPRQITENSEDAWALTSLDALLRSNEATSRAGALLLAATSADATRRQTLLSSAIDFTARATEAGAQFRQVATPRATEVFDRAAKSLASAKIAAGTRQVSLLSEDADTGDLTVEMFAAVQSQTGLRQLAQGEISQSVAVATQAQARQARLTALAVTVISALVMLAVLALSVLIGRSVSRPLRRLTHAAGRVADLAEAELQRVSDEDSLDDALPRLAEIGVSTQDEIGELAQAYNRVQTTASRLLERQVVSRRNVAAMFASIGRRTTNLVGRQLALIDSLERREEDNATLATLYQLDHLSTRLRRNATSLVVLSGGSESAGGGRPLALVDAIRGSLGSVEDYARVEVDRLPNVGIAPGALGDLLLMFAEVLENAVLFSPPSTSVRVTGELDEHGACHLAVIDLGLGMPTDRLLQENERLRRRERLDLAPSHVLGLFVVGRIARRHEIDVRLEPNPDRGITARIDLPASLLLPLADSPTGAAPAAPARHPAPPRTAPSAPAPTAQPAGPAASTPVSLPAGSGEVTPREDADSVPSIRRRVPGAQLPTAERNQRPEPKLVVPVADPERARRQVDDLEQAIARAAEAPAASAPPPPPDARAGITRRVRGSALQALGSDATPRQGAGTPVVHDPESLRSDLDQVGAAIDLAGHGLPQVSPAEERRAAEAAESALREATGRRDEQREAMSALADELRSGSHVLDPIDSETIEATPAPPQPDGILPPRRIPGRALAELEPNAEPHPTTGADGGSS